MHTRLVRGYRLDELVAAVRRRVHEVDCRHRVVNVASGETKGRGPASALYRRVNLCGEPTP
jgi:hypothetical protein